MYLIPQSLQIGDVGYPRRFYNFGGFRKFNIDKLFRMSNFTVNTFYLIRNLDASHGMEHFSILVLLQIYSSKFEYFLHHCIITIFFISFTAKSGFQW